MADLKVAEGRYTGNRWESDPPCDRITANGDSNPRMVCPEKSSSANRCKSGLGNCEPALQAGGQVEPRNPPEAAFFIQSH